MDRSLQKVYHQKSPVDYFGKSNPKIWLLDYELYSKAKNEIKLRRVVRYLKGFVKIWFVNLIVVYENEGWKLNWISFKEELINRFGNKNTMDISNIPTSKEFHFYWKEKIEKIKLNFPKMSDKDQLNYIFEGFPQLLKILAMDSFGFPQIEKPSELRNHIGNLLLKNNKCYRNRKWFNMRTFLNNNPEYQVNFIDKDHPWILEKQIGELTKRKSEIMKQFGKELIDEHDSVYDDSTPEYLISLMKTPIKLHHKEFSTVINTESTIHRKYSNSFIESNVKPVITKRRIVRQYNQNLTRIDFVQYIEVEMNNNEYSHELHLWERIEEYIFLMDLDFSYKTEICINYKDGTILFDDEFIYDLEIQNEKNTLMQHSTVQKSVENSIQPRKEFYFTKKKFTGLLNAIENFEKERKRIKVHTEELKRRNPEEKNNWRGSSNGTRN